jgi:hypothetical protein
VWPVWIAGVVLRRRSHLGTLRAAVQYVCGNFN